MRTVGPFAGKPAGRKCRRAGTRAELGRIRELLQQTLTFKDRMPDEEEARILLDTSLMGEEDGGKRPEEAEADAFKARMESIVAEHLGDAAFVFQKEKR